MITDIVVKLGYKTLVMNRIYSGWLAAHGTMALIPKATTSRRTDVGGSPTAVSFI